MGIIPLEKLIEYKGNRYELTRAMIDLVKKGQKLLSYETKYYGGKYIQVVVKNILDGKIKYGYKDNLDMQVDEHAPFTVGEEGYDDSVYAKEVEEAIAKETEEENASSDDNTTSKIKKQ